jgi:hypothetical protein
MVVRHVLSGQGQLETATSSAYLGTFGPSYSGAYIVTPTNAALTLGTTSNFTIEWWMYSTAYSYFGWLGCPMCFNYAGTGPLRLDTSWNSLMGSVSFATRPAPPLNVWTHFAASRSGGTGYVHINGVQYASAANSTNFNMSNSIIGGYNNASGQEWCGYLSQLRISNIARYSNGLSFLPKIILPSDSNTVFLTLNSSSFVDNGPLNLGALAVTSGSNTPTMISSSITRTVLG